MYQTKSAENQVEGSGGYKIRVAEVALNTVWLCPGEGVERRISGSSTLSWSWPGGGGGSGYTLLYLSPPEKELGPETSEQGILSPVGRRTDTCEDITFTSYYVVGGNNTLNR